MEGTLAKNFCPRCLGHVNSVVMQKVTFKDNEIDTHRTYVQWNCTNEDCGWESKSIGAATEDYEKPLYLNEGDYYKKAASRHGGD